MSAVLIAGDDHPVYLVAKGELLRVGVGIAVTAVEALHTIRVTAERTPIQMDVPMMTMFAARIPAYILGLSSSLPRSEETPNGTWSWDTRMDSVFAPSGSIRLATLSIRAWDGRSLGRA